MNEAKYKKSDFILKWLVLLGSGIAFIWGMYEYRENAAREFKKPFLEQQIETCQEVTALVAQIARIENNAKRAEQVDRLSILYFSKAALFLTDEALREFRVFIDLVVGCENKEKINECHYLNMGGYQFNVAKACRNELIRSWNHDMELLKEDIGQPMSW